VSNQRNDEAEPCGTYFIVNDYLPKPVALIDSEGRLAGSGDYDVFGRVNEVTVSQDTPAAAGTPPQPFGAYLPSQNLVLAYLKQPATSASLAVQLRVRYAAINTGSAGDFTWVEDGTTGAALTPPYQGWVLGEKTTPWLPVGAAGLVHVRWQSDGVGEPATYSGVTVGSYEYRRYEVAASPWWVPLRFPGQYADAESGLFENWNRFYEPGTGRYSASDPLFPSPGHLRGGVYQYASNSPLGRFDRDGRQDGAGVERRVATAQQITASCVHDGNKDACKVVTVGQVFAAVTAIAMAGWTAWALLAPPAQVAAGGAAAKIAVDNGEKAGRTFDAIASAGDQAATTLAEKMTTAGYAPTQTAAKTDPSRIVDYAQQMASGQWQWSSGPGQSIVLDPNNAILDGHHRVAAAVMSNTSIPAESIYRTTAETVRPTYTWFEVLPPTLKGGL